MAKKLLLSQSVSFCGVFLASFCQGQSVVLDFKADQVFGGTLSILQSGSGAVDSFTSDRFDGQSSSRFKIQDPASFGSVTLTATALDSYLNVTSKGLQDGSSGYDSPGEGTLFHFEQTVIIDAIDWGSFTDEGDTFDQISLYRGIAGDEFLGTFKQGDRIGSIDFTDTNPSTMAIELSEGHCLRVAYESQSSAGGFYMESIHFTVVPEPTSCALALGLLAFARVWYRRRCAVRD